MCRVDARRVSHSFILQLDIVILLKLLESGFVNRSHRFREISVQLRVVEIEFIPIVMYDPWEDRVLGEIIE